MPSPTLDATLGGASANCYITLADANTYFANLMSYDRWVALADDDTRSRALITATNLIERLRFWGVKVDDTQALKFPRIYRTASDGTSIPKDILAACCELALSLGENSGNSTASKRENLKAAGVTSYRIADFAETFGSSGISEQSGTAGILSSMPPGVARLLADWVKVSFYTDSGRHQFGNQRDRFGQWWPKELR